MNLFPAGLYTIEALPCNVMFSGRRRLNALRFCGRVPNRLARDTMIDAMKTKIHLTVVLSGALLTSALGAAKVANPTPVSRSRASLADAEKFGDSRLWGGTDSRKDWHVTPCFWTMFQKPASFLLKEPS